MILSYRTAGLTGADVRLSLTIKVALGGGRRMSAIFVAGWWRLLVSSSPLYQLVHQ